MIPPSTEDLSKTWYAVYTKPRWEKKVAALLERKQIEHYCPLNRVMKQWSDRKKLVLEPLFTSYVFVRVAESAKWQIKEIDGILNYVYWLGKPASIPNEEIDLIRRFLSEHQNVEISPLKLKKHDQVRIISGPFMHKEAEVIAVKGNKVEVHIPSLSIALSATLKSTNLALLKN